MNPISTPTRMAAWLESAWLARYLERQLDGDELAWFEAYLLDKPELLAMIEADNGLHDALMAQPATWRSSPDLARQIGEAHDILVENTSPQAGMSGSIDSWRRQVTQAVAYTSSQRTPESKSSSLSSARFALAASLVLGVGVGWFGQRSLQLDPSESASVANPPRIIYDTFRGETQSPREEIGDPASPIMLIEVPVPAGVQIVGARIERVARNIELHPPHASSEGFVTFALPAQWRGHGRLVLTLRNAVMNDGESTIYFDL